MLPSGGVSERRSRPCSRTPSRITCTKITASFKGYEVYRAREVDSSEKSPSCCWSSEFPILERSLSVIKNGDADPGTSES